MMKTIQNLKFPFFAFLLVCIFSANAWSWCWIRDTGRTGVYCSYGYQQRCCSGNLRLWSDATMQYRISNSTASSLITYIGTGASKWNNVAMSNFTFSEGARTDAWDYEKDGINVINIDSSFCAHFPSYCGEGVLGFSGTWTSGSGTSYHAIESDVILNGEEYTWGNGTGDTLDTIAVIAHELGHSAGLSHPGSTCRSSGSTGCGRDFKAATMYYALDVGFTTDKASLELDDAAALIYGYPVSALRIRVVDSGGNPISGASVKLLGTSSPKNGYSISSGGKVYGDINASLIGDKASSNTYVSTSPFSNTSSTGYTNYIYPINQTFSVKVSKDGNTVTQKVTAPSGTSTATVAIDNYCSFSISPTSASFESSGGTGSVAVTTATGCDWNANSNSSWIKITSSSSGSGNGTVSYSVSSNSSSSSRTGSITVAWQTFTVTQYGVVSPGTQKWTYETGGIVESSPAVDSNGIIYVGVADGGSKFCAINADGTEKWTLSIGLVYSSPALGSNGTIYVGAFSGKLYAIDREGKQKWVFDTGSSLSSSPAIGSDGSIYVGTWNGNFYAINPDGTQKWVSDIGSVRRSSPAIATDGTIYIGAGTYGDGNLYAINPDGTVKWSLFIGDWSTIDSSPAISSDGTIYIRSAEGKLYAVSANGAKKWAFAQDGSGWLNSSPVVGLDGSIYFSPNEYLYSLNPDGSAKWAFKTGEDVESTPAIGANGTIYVGSNDGNLYAISSDGSQEWKLHIGDKVVSSPAIGSNGTIYVGSRSGKSGSFSGKLYAIKSLSGNLADTPWPMFRNNLNHTGRASALSLYVESSGRCNGKVPCYSSVQDAIEAADSGATIKIVSGTSTDDVCLDSSKNLSILGGWDSNFSSQSSSSAMCSIKIKKGAIKVDKIVLK